MNATPQIILDAIKRRTDAGLKLTFRIPDRAEPWVCFPSSETVRQQWIESGKRKGWTLLD